MAWTSRFSGNPANDDIIQPASGTCTITRPGGDRVVFTTSQGSSDFRWEATSAGAHRGGIAYETLASMGASASNVLRVHARLAAWTFTADSGFSDTNNLRTGVCLFADRENTYQHGVHEYYLPSLFFPGIPQGWYVAQKAAADTWTSNISADWGGAPPTINGVEGNCNLFRLYYNPTGSPFVIPDSGFGSYSVPAGNNSYWYSADNGSTWTRLADHAISGTTPTKVGVFQGSQTNPGGVHQSVFGIGVFGPTLTVDEWAAPPTGVTRSNDETATAVDTGTAESRLFVQERREDEAVVASDWATPWETPLGPKVLAGINKGGTNGAVLQRNAGTGVWDETQDFPGASNLAVYDVQQLNADYAAACIPNDTTGATGFFHVFEGGSWVDKTSLLPTYCAPHSLFVAGVDDIWIGGFKTQSGSSGEAIWHYDGASVTQKYLSTLSSTARADALGGVDTNLVYLAGQRVGFGSGRLTRITGGSTVNQWNLPGTTSQCESISVLDSSNIYIGGTHGSGYAGVYHFDGSGGFTDLGNPGSGAQIRIYGLWARSTSEVWAAGYFISGGTGAGIWLWNGASWSLQQNPTWSGAQGRSATGLRGTGEAWFGVYGTTTQRALYWNGASFGPQETFATGSNIRKMSAILAPESVDRSVRENETVTAVDTVKGPYSARKYPVYLAASVSDGGDAYPVILLRETGSSAFVEVHRNATLHTSSGGTGFANIDGLPDASFMVAVGQAFFKAGIAPQAGCLSWFDGWVWADAVVPSTYHFCDVYVPEEGVAYVTGYDTGTPQTGRIWRWTPSGGFVEVHSRYYSTSFRVGFHHIRGSGPNNIWASLVFVDNAVYNPSWVVHFDGDTWTDYNIRRRLISVVNDELAYANSFNGWNGSDPSLLYKLQGSTWSEIESLPYTSNNQMYGIDAREDYALFCAYRSGNRVYKWTAETGAVSKISSGARFHTVEISLDGTSAIAIANNQSVLISESTDKGETWTPLSYLQQYKYYYGGGALFAEWVPRLRHEETLNVVDTLASEGPRGYAARADESAVAVVNADISQPLEGEAAEGAGFPDQTEFPSSSVDTPFWQTPEIPSGTSLEDALGGFSDQHEFPTSSQGTDFWQTPPIPDGVVLPELIKPLGGGFSDSVFITLGSANYSADEQTTDSEGHPHLITYRPYLMYSGDISAEPWANPTTTNFTGYAADGTRYTDGVQDVGPVYAPWYSEVASNDRSSVGAFPTKYLIAVSRLELVIYDLANYPTNLDVWMRFRRGETTGSSYTLLGRQAETLADARMLNGVLIATTLENGTDRGRLHLIDFRQDTQRYANLIGSDNHWMGLSGQDITDRNLSGVWTTSGVSPSLRISPEYPYSLAAYSAADGSKYWVVVAGEDQGPDVIEVDFSGVPQLRSAATGDTGGDNLGNVRQVLIDRDGWLWHSYYGQLYRNGLKYQEGVVSIPSLLDPSTPMIDLGTTIWDMVDSENYIYAATDEGVYRIHRGTMDSRLLWTISGGGGVGKDNIPGSGEILVGTKPMVNQIRAYTLNGSGYVVVASKLDGGNLHGGVTLIRTNDETVLDSMEFPDLAEDGAYVGIPVGL
ncbi:MAG: hypothetical protein GWN58_34005 [Anaerolineae bacterium]|nr:hypothetical protein [Thermoplasmata archaeon]NIV34294.1 hypothetical protein [Anaerolineae bacterium]NIY06143.1 hypothetical protein [Thermoplasmata archaeon]